MGRPTPATRNVTPTYSTSSSSSLGKVTSHSLTDEEADWVVRRTEMRVSQVLAKSPFLNAACRLKSLPRFTHEDIVIGDMIASGGFSNVHGIEAFKVQTDLTEGPGRQEKRYVVKHLNPKLAGEPKKLAVGAKDLVMEAHFLSSLDHENIISLRGMCSAGVAGYAATGRADGFFLVFDELEGTLSQRLSRWRSVESKQNAKSPFFKFGKHAKNGFTFNDRIQVAYEIAKAIAYLHDNGILYRDLKPANVGFDDEGVLKIFDFGLAVELPASEDPNQLYNLAGNTGTARYMAPEVIKNQPYNFKADVFSFSTLLWEILALKKPHAELSGQEVKEWVAEFGNRPPIQRNWPRAIRTLMKNSWSDNIEERPTMSEVRDTLASLLV